MNSVYQTPIQTLCHGWDIIRDVNAISGGNVGYIMWIYTLTLLFSEG